ncbi:unnamed protein product, partial [Ectocarpus sp. 13 AM-2016]
MDDDIDIEELLALETELKTQREESAATSSVSLDAKLNMLKYLQVKTVHRYEAAYDGMYYELNKRGDLECVRHIALTRSEELVQPKFLELQDCSEGERLESLLEYFLADAKLAKECLDKLVAEATRDLELCEVQRVDVKSLESTRRKTIKFCGGD